MKVKRLMMIFTAIIITAGAACSAAYAAARIAPQAEHSLVTQEVLSGNNDDYELEAEGTGNPTSLFSSTVANILGYDFGYVADSDITYVSKINLAKYTIEQTPIISITNRTDYKIDLDSLLSESFEVKDKDYTQPLVLIIHTHGTEAYISNDKEYYYSNDRFRSTDTDKNIVAVGDEFCAELAKYGIISIHDRTMHDELSYSKAYKSSGASVEAYLKKYPSIKYVVDIHRDSICYDNIYKKPVTTIDGQDSAQVMIVVGTDANGASHPDWQENLIVALKWQEILNEQSPTLARPIYIHKSSFNQFNMPTMLLLEVGGAANTLEEALQAARHSAAGFAELILRY